MMSHVSPVTMYIHHSNPMMMNQLQYNHSNPMVMNQLQYNQLINPSMINEYNQFSPLMLNSYQPNIGR